MKRFFMKFSLFTVFLLALGYTLLPVGSASAAIQDGTYDINYEVKEANSNNTSIADGYFTKPATLTVENGVQYVQFTVTSAEMVKSLSTTNGPVSVVSDQGDKRTVKFKVNGDLSNPVQLKMHVVVPEEALPGGYDMEHTARAIFDVSGLPQASASGNSATDDGDQSGNGLVTSNDSVENPPTGDQSPLIFYGLLFVGALGALIVVRRFRRVYD